MEKKTGYDAVVFDMDGVIFDSERKVFALLSITNCIVPPVVER